MCMVKFIVRVTKHNKRRNAMKKRQGFTLIELLMVMSVIAVLAALLIPAVQSVMSRAKIAEVKVEMSQLEAAIADFNAEFSTNPPSQVILYESPAGWVDDPEYRSLIRGI